MTVVAEGAALSSCSTMAKAGDQYEFRTGNIWNFSHRDDVNTARRLVEEGVDAELRNKVGWTPLHAAAAGGSLRVLEYLLRLKQPRRILRDPSCRAGRTPLMEAARAGQLEAAKLLVAEGAEITAEDHSGRCVLEHAKGTAMRSWLEQKLGVLGSDRGAERSQRSAHARERRPERQPIGASSKQKAALLKARRAAQREAAARTREPEPPSVALAAAALAVAEEGQEEEVVVREGTASRADLAIKCDTLAAATARAAASGANDVGPTAAEVADAGRARGRQPLRQSLDESTGWLCCDAPPHWLRRRDSATLSASLMRLGTKDLMGTKDFIEKDIIGKDLMGKDLMCTQDLMGKDLSPTAREIAASAERHACGEADADGARVCLLCVDARRPLLHLPAALELRSDERLVVGALHCRYIAVTLPLH